MGRDKLITIRIEEEARDKFNQLCEDKGYSSSKAIYDFIHKCLSGDVNLESLKDETIDNSLASQLSERVSQLESKVNSNIDIDIDRQIKEAVNQLENSLEDRILEKLTA